ncbi:MAG: hypothetical protein WC523_07800 [Patescibacteria group bacterium]
MEKNIKKFIEFFCNLGELCLKIKMVERGLQSYDFTRKEGQAINPDYFDEVKKKYPKTIRGFGMAIERKWCDHIFCYLQESGEVIVEFHNQEHEIEKTITYPSVKNMDENKIALIHFLTRAWDPITK